MCFGCFCTWGQTTQWYLLRLIIGTSHMNLAIGKFLISDFLCKFLCAIFGWNFSSREHVHIVNAYLIKIKVSLYKDVKIGWKNFDRISNISEIQKESDKANYGYSRKILFWNENFASELQNMTVKDSYLKTARTRYACKAIYLRYITLNWEKFYSVWFSLIMHTSMIL